MIEKLKGKKELLHPGARAWENETDEQRAARRAGLTDLQVDQEDAAMAEAAQMDKETGTDGSKQPVSIKDRAAQTAKNNKGARDPNSPSEINEAPEPPKFYRPITVTRESDRPGDIKTTEQRKKTVGA